MQLCDGDYSAASTLTGNLAACHNLATFLALPTLGLLSDRFGRVPIFLLGFVTQTRSIDVSSGISSMLPRSRSLLTFGSFTFHERFLDS